MTRRIAIALLLLATAAFAQAPTPEQFLGYKLGDRFTPWPRIVEYFNALAKSSNLIIALVAVPERSLEPQSGAQSHSKRRSHHHFAVIRVPAPLISDLGTEAYTLCVCADNDQRCQSEDQKNVF